MEWLPDVPNGSIKFSTTLHHQRSNTFVSQNPNLFIVLPIPFWREWCPNDFAKSNLRIFFLTWATSRSPGTLVPSAEQKQSGRTQAEGSHLKITIKIRSVQLVCLTWWCTWGRRWGPPRQCMRPRRSRPCSRQSFRRKRGFCRYTRHRRTAADRRDTRARPSWSWAERCGALSVCRSCWPKFHSWGIVTCFVLIFQLEQTTVGILDFSKSWLTTLRVQFFSFPRIHSENWKIKVNSWQIYCEDLNF